MIKLDLWKGNNIIWGLYSNYVTIYRPWPKHLNLHKKVSEYDQKIPHSHTADQHTAPWRGNKSGSTRYTIAKWHLSYFIDMLCHLKLYSCLNISYMYYVSMKNECHTYSIVIVYYTFFCQQEFPVHNFYQVPQNVHFWRRLISDFTALTNLEQSLIWPFVHGCR